MSDCTFCRSFKKSVELGNPLLCHEAEYYTPGQFSYCRNQILFYLANRELIREGVWPPDPKGTGYIDSAIHPQNVRAPKEWAKLIAADIEPRLAQTKVDGEWLVREAERDTPIIELSSYCLSALNYISGFKAKSQGYKQWQAECRRVRKANYVVA
jgi:hypothetical protein